jgi:RHS repeat-associated protein
LKHYPYRIAVPNPNDKLENVPSVPTCYAPTGQKMQIMNGQAPPTKEFVSLPGGGQAVFTASGQYYYHSDHLGSFRFGSTSNRTMYFDLAHAPFGDIYANAGSIDPAFTGQRADTVPGLYDFPAREYNFQGRWASPDPAGLAAVDPSNPQSWNRYSYVKNNPLNSIDPLGLSDCIDGHIGCNCNIETGDCTNDFYGPHNPGNGCSITSVTCGSGGFGLAGNRMFLQAGGIISSFDIIELANTPFGLLHSADNTITNWDNIPIVYPFAGLLALVAYDTPGRVGGSHGPSAVSAGQGLINQQYAAELECEMEVLKEGKKEFATPELPEFGPPIQVPNPGGEELSPPPEPNPLIKDLLQTGGKLIILQVGRTACQQQYPLSRLHP